MKYFSLSHLLHVVIALAMQAAVGLITGNWLAGACLAIGFYVSREHAQREYWIMGTEALDRSQVGFWRGFTGWDTDAIGDVLWPSLAVLLVWLCLPVVTMLYIAAKVL